MNAISLLKKDHSTVKKLLGNFAAARGDASQRKEEIAKKTFTELEMHSTIEEGIFYPAVQQAADEKGKDMVREAVEEHGVVKGLIAELKAMSPEAEEYDAKFKVLTEQVQHHVTEEESEMFPRAQRTLGIKKLNDLGVEMGTRKEELMHPGVLQQARELVTKAFDAMVGSHTSKSDPRHSYAKRETLQPVRSMPRSATRTRPRTNRTVKTGVQPKRARAAGRMVKKARAKKATRKMRPRKAARTAARARSRRRS